MFISEIKECLNTWRWLGASSSFCTHFICSLATKIRNKAGFVKCFWGHIVHENLVSDLKCGFSIWGNLKEKFSFMIFCAWLFFSFVCCSEICSVFSI
jgi:hypothetical protein